MQRFQISTWVRLVRRDMKQFARYELAVNPNLPKNQPTVKPGDSRTNANIRRLSMRERSAYYGIKLEQP